MKVEGGIITYIVVTLNNLAKNYYYFLEIILFCGTISTMKSTSEKTPQESEITMRELVMPHQTNPQGTVFGGVIMSWIDMAAAMVAARHAQCDCVTVHIDQIHFMAPAKIGHHVFIKAKLIHVGRTSMDIIVNVRCENPHSGNTRPMASATLTFVAMDEIGRPNPVPRLKLTNPEEEEEFAKMAARKKQRKE